MKILITGASGLLGGNLAFLYSCRYAIVAGYFQHAVSIPKCKMRCFDLCSQDETIRTLAEEKPDVIIHCAANANVDDCEINRSQAYRANVEATKIICKASDKSKTRLIFISTDSVFADDKQKSFREFDRTNPKNVYAQTKLEAEKIVQSFAENSLIIRTCIYGFNILPKMSLAEWIISELTAGRSINGFNDVFFTPILVNDLASAIEIALQKNLNGIYHIASRDTVSKYDFACQLAKKFNLPPSQIKPSSISNSQLRAFRPKRPCLNVSKFEVETKKYLPSVFEGIDQFYKLSTKQYGAKIKTFHASDEVVIS